MTSVPRAEHPRPQQVRDQWQNLNGRWSFSIDPGRSGIERDFQRSGGFGDSIIVPYCPESALSEVEHTDFIDEAWYQRTISIPEEWKGKDVLLHFGGVDYIADIYLDGDHVANHFGGTSSFSVDLSNRARPGGTHNLVVRVRDNIRGGTQPIGKQRSEYEFRRQRCSYTRTTGIWSTVWMEAVAPGGLLDCTVVPDLDGSRLVCIPRFRSIHSGASIRVTASVGDKPVGQSEAPQVQGLPIVVDLPETRPWGPDDPFLYTVEIEIRSSAGAVVDRVQSYTGLRKIHVEGNRIYLNNEPLYLRLVLDQGFYPDGVWTAPSDADLKRDIELSMAAGFNGARLHQKVFDERFHYWADRLGYLTWAESASWGIAPTDPLGARNFLAEWRELVVRDRNHPSIIAWTPLNETRQIKADPEQHRRFHRDLYRLTHDLDPTRPVNDASGYIHVETDLWTVHDYTQDPESFANRLRPEPGEKVFRCRPDDEPQYAGQPYLVDEFGGVLWISDPEHRHSDTSWGYGEGPKNEAECLDRIEGLVDAILSYDHISGYCYTQLTDVEQEQNGIYNYDRSAKFPQDRVYSVFSKEPRDGSSAGS